MKPSELKKQRLEFLNKYYPYKMQFYMDFNFKILNNIMYYKKAGRGIPRTYNDIIIMADTETSKKSKGDDNHIVAWTISMRAFNRNIVTIWGRKPSEMMEAFQMLVDNLNGFEIYIYFHNLAYDWTFLKKFIFQKFGFPEKQLNTKPHYPISIEFENGIILKDSLILAQRNLDKWSKDLAVEHQKAVGKWDYDKLRNQNESFSFDELEYIEHDTLAGVECIQAMMDTLGKSIYSMPYTATGIPREQVREIGKENRARQWFLKQFLTWEQYQKALMVYHGGYTHGFRKIIDKIVEWVKGYDFASSYPFCMLAYKYPNGKFMKIADKSVWYILEFKEKYAFMFKLILVNPILKNDDISMPALQFSKCTKTINAVLDNGRILGASYIECYMNEVDLEVICNQYDFDLNICTEVEFTTKSYLPRWLTDYIYQLFIDKTKLKGQDPVLYALAKSKLNSVYGMHCQRAVKDTIVEDYETGEYFYSNENEEELYQKYIDRYTSILPFQIGCWVTSYAYRNLFRLGYCVDYENGGIWCYSDTDSCYATKWNVDKVNQYNENCKQLLLDNGYGAVNHNGRDYWLGVAEHDPKEDVYSEFKTLGAKRYCGRHAAGKHKGELAITLAGVPKVGYKCLKNDINNFTSGMIFDGTTTGKLTHTYINVDEIYIDENGNETGDSINLTSCDYLLSAIDVRSLDDLVQEEVSIQIYDEKDYSLL
ncbi:MAG: hypothetical protein KBT36_14835 [Kurthia sp.]|nr:hypothetical protein [Candidatus Kurthia equi]